VSDDATLGGYEAAHDRPPAFEGPDGRAYSAAVYVDDVPHAQGQFGGAVLFVRWSRDGDRPDGHVESPYLAFGTTPAEAEERVRALTLLEVKRHLDAAVTAAREDPD
jgi:hypothetical protein